MLELSLLGRPTVRWHREPVEAFVSDKAVALLAYLVVNEGSHARDTLAGLLWGEMPQTRARANLRMALYNLNDLLPGYLESTRKVVSFRHDLPHFLDLSTLEAAGRATTAEDLRDALTLARGEFLEGLFVDAAPQFEEWVRAERERWRLHLLSLLERLLDHESARGEWGAATDIARRLVTIEPWRESSHRRLMRLLARRRW